MSAYSTEEWHDFYVAAAGASAALLGLVFVALSINLERILSYAWLPGRAAETIVILGGGLMWPLLGLFPQSSTALGSELTAAALIVLAIPGAIQVRARRRYRGEQRVNIGRRVLTTLVATAPAVVGGVTVLTGAGGGLYWVAAGILLSIVVGIANAWVMLIEILR